MHIMLNSFEKITEFVNLMAKVEDEIDLVSARRFVDAKSIMGIFSLDLSRPIEARIQGETKSERTIEILRQFAS